MSVEDLPDEETPDDEPDDNKVIFGDKDPEDAVDDEDPGSRSRGE
jgi:hypothetical protein